MFLTLRIAGHLDAGWLDWFNGLEMRHREDGSTELYGPVVDQAALHGVLNQARDLGLTLLSVVVEAAEPGETDKPGELKTED
jgi:hypothetical protein